MGTAATEIFACRHTPSRPVALPISGARRRPDSNCPPESPGTRVGSGTSDVPRGPLPETANASHNASGHAACGLGTASNTNVRGPARSEGHTSELQSLMRTSYAVFCLNKQQTNSATHYNRIHH